MRHVRLAVNDRQETIEERAVGVCLHEVVVVLDVVPGFTSPQISIINYSPLHFTAGH
jgi:hypothetical protein